MRLSVFSARRALCGLALAILVSGCASTNDVVLTSSPRLNMGDGEPHAVKVRIYYLKATEKFLTADFGALWKDDRAALGEERIAVHEHTLFPRQQFVFQHTRTDEEKAAVALGVVANFFDPKRPGCRRKVIPIGGRKQRDQIHFDEGCLSVIATP
jgi:type VI secretion system VasD/TssJ family lipoprotein